MTSDLITFNVLNTPTVIRYESVQNVERNCIVGGLWLLTNPAPYWCRISESFKALNKIWTLDINRLMPNDAITFIALNNPAPKWCRIVQIVERNCIIGVKRLQSLLGDIVRLKEGELTTEFGIYVNQDVKDGDIDMFVLRKKIKDEDGEDQTLDNQNMITTVGLFAPKIVINTEKIRPCFYAVKTSGDEVSSGVDFEKIMNAIDKDVRARKCDFKVLLASLNLDEKFDLDREIYREYKYINMKCEMTDGDSKYKYNVPRSRNLADYVIILDKEAPVSFEKCTVGLPGDEGKRGIDKLSDFEELTTHYPLSMVVKNRGP